MRTYLETLFDEKGISLDTPFEVRGASSTNYMTLENVVDAITSAPQHEQRAIKDMIVKIDFANGDVFDYMKHLAKAIAV